ncbi:hypothetical protein HYPSUDRAFT_208388 [Hypholoma sublateritium FD-334 SS-4]|uniref:Uncharacterized protein n=1 Tax=Hypholoma sublateritium (strain FD-334 SS-4) TaxID=945553 RepID=A0A0D2NDX8_HYPSF|nr:hypothetical protein HYPSUDRAFT_208388 [Hypholoma sublateritium FD-334 SS-4]
MPRPRTYLHTSIWRTRCGGRAPLTLFSALSLSTRPHRTSVPPLDMGFQPIVSPPHVSTHSSSSPARLPTPSPPVPNGRLSAAPFHLPSTRLCSPVPVSDICND